MKIVKYKGVWVSLKCYIFDHRLPIYFPKSNHRAENKIFLAIWNCGKRPQSLWKAIKDTRITIRRGVNIVFVIKKGDIY